MRTDRAEGAGVGEPFYLFVGASDSESATSRLRAEGASFMRKLLRSGPSNWENIALLLEAPMLQGALVTLTGNDYERILRPEYRDVSKRLLDAVAKAPHVVLAHEAVLLREEDRAKPEVGEAPLEDDYDDPYGFGSPEDYFGELPDEMRSPVNEMLRQRNTNVLPYRTNAERSVLAAAFLEDHERHLLFRVYIPSGRLYAEEADTILRLFQNWLNQTGRLAVRQDGYQTPAGQVYEFFASTPPTSHGGLAAEFQRFSDFLDACMDRPEAAAEQLLAVGIEPTNATSLISRYSKAARRLKLDMRQSREARVLQLKHEFESEILEINSGEAEPRSALESWLPSASSLAGVLAPFAAAGSQSTNVNLTFNQQIVQEHQGTLVQSIEGTVNLNPEAREILALVREFGGGKSLDLESAVHELEDEQARSSNRFVARQKLRSFLAGLASQVPGMALTTLHKYLEGRLGVS